MGLNGAVHEDSQRLVLLPTTTIGAAVAATATGTVTRLGGMRAVAVQATFAYGAGGTTTKAFIQTSFDGGTTWADIMCFAFTTSALTRFASVFQEIIFAASPYAPVALTDGSLGDNTCVQGFLGDRLRLKYVTTGTYTGLTSLTVNAHVKG